MGLSAWGLISVNLRFGLDVACRLTKRRTSVISAV